MAQKAQTTTGNQMLDLISNKGVAREAAAPAFELSTLIGGGALVKGAIKGIASKGGLIKKGPIGAAKEAVGSARKKTLEELGPGKVEADKIVGSIQKWADNAPATIKKRHKLLHKK